MCGNHYRKQSLCQVSEVLGKAWKTLGEGFAECDTRQREVDKLYISNGFFAEYFLSDTRQTKVAITATGNRDRPLPSVLGDTRQRASLYRAY
jgi:hypothetical protein